MKYLLMVFVAVAAMTSEAASAIPIPIGKAAGISDVICGFPADYIDTSVAVLSTATSADPVGTRPTIVNKAWRASAMHTTGQNKPCPLMDGGSTLFGGLIMHCNQTQMLTTGCCLKMPDPVGSATNGNNLSPTAAVESNEVIYSPGGFIITENKTLSTTEHLRRMFRPPAL